MSTQLEQLVHELTLSVETIKKWHKVAFEKKEDYGWYDCAFCTTDPCRVCPIVKYRFGSSECQKTPYNSWYAKTDIPRIADTPEKQHLAVKELLFLIKVANHIGGLIEKEVTK